MEYTEVVDRVTGFYHYYPGIPTVVGVRDPRNGVNFMPAVWNTGLSFDPPLFGVSVSKKRYTYGLLQRERRFSASFHPFEQARVVQQIGAVSGREVNKVERFRLSYFWGRTLKVPILQGAYAAYELELLEVYETGDHDLFVGRVRGVWEQREALDTLHRPDPSKVSPLLYYGRLRYGKPDRTVVDFNVEELLKTK